MCPVRSVTHVSGWSLVKPPTGRLHSENGNAMLELMVTLGQQRQLDDVAAGLCRLCRQHPALPDERRCAACIEALDAELVEWKLFDKHAMCAQDPPMGLSQKWAAFLLKPKTYRRQVEMAAKLAYLERVSPITKTIQ
jgi:hypothetical protein